MNVTFMVTVGILIMLVLVVSFLVITVINMKRKSQLSDEMQSLKVEQQNQLIEAAVRSEETERHRIAEALHDEVGAILSSTKLHLQGIKTGSMDERDKQLYDKGKELLDEGIQKVRGISHNLHSNILKEFGLNEAIQHFVSKITHDTLIKSSTELDAGYTTQSPENDISIYRLVQELVNNILKHSGATEIKIHSVYESNNLQIVIRHNGKGLTQEHFEQLRYHKDGLGLKNIQNRIILLKGRISFSSEGEYYQTKIDVPVNTSTK
jgi:two-component system NarL family sensor kinase